MAQELTQELIQHLVEIGASQRFDDDERLFARFPLSRSGAFMRLRQEAWYEATSSLDVTQLVALIKTLTVLEQRLPNFSSGSVSPVIALFHTLSERSSDDLAATVDWVLLHTDNPYLPFGRHNCGAKSFSELPMFGQKSRTKPRSP